MNFSRFNSTFYCRDAPPGRLDKHYCRGPSLGRLDKSYLIDHRFDFWHPPLPIIPYFGPVQIDLDLDLSKLIWIWMGRGDKGGMGE